MNQQQQQTEEDYCGAHGWEPLGDDCDCGVKENPVEPPMFLIFREEVPLMVWDGNVKQTIVEVKCGNCKTVYKDRQCRNDCVSAYPYEYPKKGFYWMENKECYNCYKSRV